MRCIEVVDKRKEKGGDRKSENQVPKSVFDSKPSHIQTAETVGIGKSKVMEARTILDHADPETKQKVLSGQKSIHRAAQETQEKRKHRESERPVFNRTNENRPRIHLYAVLKQRRMGLFKRIYTLVWGKGRSGLQSDIPMQGEDANDLFDTFTNGTTFIQNIELFVDRDISFADWTELACQLHTQLAKTTIYQSLHRLQRRRLLSIIPL